MSLRLLFFFLVSICFTCGLKVPKNATEEELINFFETHKLVKSYNDLHYFIGNIWEPSKSDINKHHNYTEMTTYLKNLSEKFPHLSSLNSIGRSVEGRELWIITVGAMAKHHVAGPAVLLHNYERNLYIRRLLDTTRIHLLPSMNPDGYEQSIEGDESGVRGRANANGIDLNRNFPAHDSYRAYYQPAGTSPRQTETELLMEWTRSIPFVLSANLHSGTTLVNYPWDDGHGARARTGDNELFVALAYSYSRGHKRMWKKGPRCLDNRLNDPLDPTLGIVNGASWYEVSGGMQDWNYAFSNTFEVTVEMSCVKFPNANELFELWNEHKYALLHFIDLTHNTIHGFVFDEQTGHGVFNTSVQIGEKEKVVYSWRNGDYWRLILPGTHEITFRHQNYYPKTVVVNVSEFARSLNFNVTLRPHSYVSAHGSIRPFKCYAMAFSRVELVKKLIREPPSSGADETESPNDADDELLRKRSWNDLNSFVGDHLAEVIGKLEKIEPEIWGKLGIRIKCDKKGNIWLKQNGGENPICVQCAQYPEPIFLNDNYQKIVDLRSFRDSLIHELEVRSTVQRNKLFRKAVIFMKLTDADPEKNPLECGLWLTLIHLVSVDMINALVNEQSDLPAVDSSPNSPIDSNEQASSSSSQCESPFVTQPKLSKRPSFLTANYNGDSAAEDSSASTSSYVPSSSSSNSGVARRIFNQQHPQRSQSVRRERPSRSHRSPTFRPSRGTQPPDSSGYNRVPSVFSPLNESREDELQTDRRKRSLSQPRMTPNGWSLLNLTDIDRIPLYFSSNEEAARGRRMKRGGAGHQFNSQTNLQEPQLRSDYNDDENVELPPRLEPTVQRSRRSSSSRPRVNITWLSETSLRNVA
ncbi:Peptidase-M14 domain-containing protein [Aphelenchoides besseyi]|nr:Peptidase-M14 domain-containing protein [Aphelenchoides besseyi]